VYKQGDEDEDEEGGRRRSKGWEESFSYSPLNSLIVHFNYFPP
jgi:hypothetical protein